MSEFKIDEVEISEAVERKTEPKPKPKVEVVKKHKKPKSYVKGRYSKLPPTKVINKFIVSNTNERFLKDKEKKLTLKDCEIGEATMYMVEWYTEIDPYHPALVMMGAMMGFGLTVMELQSGKDAKSD